MSYKLFELNSGDAEALNKKKEVVRLQISKNDPFMGARPKWETKHSGVFNTVQLMENLQPYQTREHSNVELIKSMCDQERRFYQNDFEAQQREANKFAKRQKTLRLIDNYTEQDKLKRLSKDLGGSRQLLDVDEDWNLFEKETNADFNNMMNAKHKQEIENSGIMMPSRWSRSIDPTSRRGKSQRFDKPHLQSLFENGKDYSAFRFSKRAQNLLSPLNVRATRIN